MPDRYTRPERAELIQLLGREGAPACPRCGQPVDRRAVPPRSEVSYVRNRLWVVCGGCGASAVFDRREIDRASEE